jgi:phosphoribosylamine--glycine ligase
VPLLGEDEVADLVEQVHGPVVEELARRGSPFVGVLFAGLMLTASGAKVLEFNCRFGDPETQSILPRIDCDLLEMLAAAATGDVTQIALEVLDDAAVTIVLAGAGYPEASDSGTPIAGVEEAEADAFVFHAGTAVRDGKLVTAGGRILDVTAVAPTLEQARDAAYAAAERIRFEGMHYRRDIAARTAGVAR